MQELASNTTGVKDWNDAVARKLLSVSASFEVGSLRLVASAFPSQSSSAQTTPSTYLSSRDDPVLAKVWDNSDDDIYDTL